MATLPDRLTVWPGHDYGSAPHSTLGRERAGNYTLKPRSVADFVAFMAAPAAPRDGARGTGAALAR